MEKTNQQAVTPPIYSMNDLVSEFMKLRDQMFQVKKEMERVNGIMQPCMEPDILNAIPQVPEGILPAMNMLLHDLYSICRSIGMEVAIVKKYIGIEDSEIKS